MGEIFARIGLAFVSWLAKRYLTVENFKKYGDKWLFDKMEDFIVKSEPKWDDQLLPVVRALREMFGVPDLPD